MDRAGTKRSRSRSPPWRRLADKAARMSEGRSSPQKENRFGVRGDRLRHGQPSSVKEQARLNQLQEDERMREWVAQEDTFVLKQRKKKANIRVKEGRAQPIDRLTVLLRAIDPTRDYLDDDTEDEDRDIIEPDEVFEALSVTELTELRRDIETFLHLETTTSNREYWRALLSVSDDYMQKKGIQNPEGRAMSSVAADIDNIFRLKTFEELEKLENEIKRKLRSTEPIDTDYWEQLLKSLLVWKARSSLRRVYQAALNSRIRSFKVEQQSEAIQLAAELTASTGAQQGVGPTNPSQAKTVKGANKFWLDPDPMLQIQNKDKGLEVLDESTFLQNMTDHRQQASKIGHVTGEKGTQKKTATTVLAAKSETTPVPDTSRFAPVPNEDFSQATKALYEKEVARGISEDEEIFTGEEAVDTKSKPLWAHKHRPRKPRYFNRVQMGYEWNKYNQTHYDHSNPPPKVVQGYKFNIFYPDLIDKTKAPTYKIEREGGRKRGQSFAPAGEEDTCLIRLISGPPYEDLAFRIVDKEWDYSAKRERGFKSSFDKGILQLHFQFKKIYYRK